MVETRAELPFIGDQVVCLSHDQAARSGSGINEAVLVHDTVGGVNLLTVLAESLWRRPKCSLQSPRSGLRCWTVSARHIRRCSASATKWRGSACGAVRPCGVLASPPLSPYSAPREVSGSVAEGRHNGPQAQGGPGPWRRD